MKKKWILPLFALILIGFTACHSSSSLTADEQQPQIDSHNSQNSLDWAGVYQGVLPCADCEGIKTNIQLKYDGSFKMQSVYWGAVGDSVFTQSGQFTWGESGQTIKLSNGKRYFVGENKLIQLDGDGNRIQGELADYFILHKADNRITEKYWKLISLNGNDITVDSTFNREPYLILKANEQHRISGNAGCNQLMGTYELKPENGISFSKMASTLMACPNLNLEDQFVDALQTADKYAVNGEYMTLFEGEQPLAKFKVVYFQ